MILLSVGCGNFTRTFTFYLPLQEIVTALASKKNIVPVTDNFMWPDPMSLPEDMRAILNFNGIK